MAWTKTVTASSTPDSLGRPNEIETWSLKDRDGVDVAVVTKDADDSVSMTVGGVKVYRALLTPGDPPTATPDENTIGDIILSKDAAGTFLLTLAGAFSGSTYCTVAPLYNNDVTSNAAFFQMSKADVNSCIIKTFDLTGTPEDELTILQVQILVYPA